MAANDIYLLKELPEGFDVSQTFTAKIDGVFCVQYSTYGNVSIYLRSGIGINGVKPDLKQFLDAPISENIWVTNSEKVLSIIDGQTCGAYFSALAPVGHIDPSFSQRSIKHDYCRCIPSAVRTFINKFAASPLPVGRVVLAGFIVSGSSIPSDLATCSALDSLAIGTIGDQVDYVTGSVDQKVFSPFCKWVSLLQDSELQQKTKEQKLFDLLEPSGLFG
nr:p24 protein [Sugarcane mild mosaic virus]